MQVTSWHLCTVLIVYSEKFKVPFVETSAKTNENVSEAFFLLVRQINKYRCTRELWRELKKPMGSAAASALVKNLVEMGANINAMDGGQTVLHVAASAGKTELVSILLDHGAFIDMKIKSTHETALHVAAAQNHIQTVKLLLQRGADSSEVDNEQQTALHVAAKNGHATIVKLLLREIDMNALDVRGWNALHLASFHGYVDTVRTLLNSGISADSVDPLARNALELAGSKEVITVLSNHGCKVRLKRNGIVIPSSWPLGNL